MTFTTSSAWFFREFQLVQKCYCSMSGHWVPLWYVSFAEFKFIWQPSHSVLSKNIYSLFGMYSFVSLLCLDINFSTSLACAFRRVPLVQKSCLNYAKTFTTWHVFFGDFHRAFSVRGGPSCRGHSSSRPPGVSVGGGGTEDCGGNRSRPASGAPSLGWGVWEGHLFHQEVGAGEGPRGHRCTSRRTGRARSWGTTPGGFPGSCGAPCRSPPPD